MSIAEELDSKEIIYRIRIGRRTAFRICLAVVVWIIIMFILNKWS